MLQIQFPHGIEAYMGRFLSAILGIHMNFAPVSNVLLLLKGCGKGKTFYNAPVDLGFQPIKLLAFESFEVEHQCRSNSIEKQVCVFFGG